MKHRLFPLLTLLVVVLTSSALYGQDMRARQVQAQMARQ